MKFHFYFHEHDMTEYINKLMALGILKKNGIFLQIIEVSVGCVFICFFLQKMMTIDKILATLLIGFCVYDSRYIDGSSIFKAG